MYSHTYTMMHKHEITDMKQIWIKTWSNRYVKIRFLNKYSFAKTRFIRWTRPPEEGERTDNEDQDEEEEEILDEERRRAQLSIRRDWIVENNRSS